MPKKKMGAFFAKKNPEPEQRSATAQQMRGLILMSVLLYIDVNKTYVTNLLQDAP